MQPYQCPQCNAPIPAGPHPGKEVVCTQCQRKFTVDEKGALVQTTNSLEENKSNTRWEAFGDSRFVLFLLAGGIVLVVSFIALMKLLSHFVEINKNVG